MNNKKLIKKETKELVYKKIGAALSELTIGVENKAFEKKLQKASSLLAKDIAKAAKKDTPKKAKTKKRKEEKKAAKIIKSKATDRKTNTVPVKMNNLPVEVEVRTDTENIAP